MRSSTLQKGLGFRELLDKPGLLTEGEGQKFYLLQTKIGSGCLTTVFRWGSMEIFDVHLAVYGGIDLKDSH